eukprot:6037063-Amphidinium_carterae.1
MPLVISGSAEGFEEVVVSRVSQDGMTVSLETPLAAEHEGEAFVHGERRADVRDIVVAVERSVL